MATAPIDYAALARQAGATISQPAKPDYAKLAQQAGATKSEIKQPAITPPAAPPPGMLTRLGQSLGLPTSMEELQAMQPPKQSIPEMVTDSAAGPVGTAYKIVKGIGREIKNAYQTNEPEFEEAAQNIKAGGPLGANLGKAGYSVLKGTLEGPLAPIGGNVAQNAGEDAGAKFNPLHGNFAMENPSGFVGDALGTTALTALSMMGGKPSTTTRTNKLSYALGASGKTDYPEALKTALPELDRAASSLGKPVDTLGDLQQVIKEGFRNTENEFNTALHPIATQQVVATPIADAIRVEASKLSPKNTVEARMRNLLLNRATEYDQPWSYGELNQQRMNANGRLRVFESSSQSAQQASLRTKVDNMVDKAIADGSRDLVYDALQNHYGRDFSGLKQRQSAMTTIVDRLNDQISELKNATAVKQGAPLLSSGSINTYGHPTGGLGMSIHRLQDLFTTPLGKADKAVKSAFGSGSVAPRTTAATLMGRKTMFASSYDSPTDVMEAMKNGELDQVTGNAILQRMKGRNGVITRPLAPPQ